MFCIEPVLLICHHVLPAYAVMLCLCARFRYWQLDLDSVGQELWDRCVYEASEVYKGRMVGSYVCMKFLFMGKEICLHVLESSLLLFVYSTACTQKNIY